MDSPLVLCIDDLLQVLELRKKSWSLMVIASRSHRVATLR